MDVLGLIDPNEPEARLMAHALATTLVPTDIGRDRENWRERAYWDEAARDMLTVLILHVLTAPEYEGQRNLVTVRRLLVESDAATLWETVRQNSTQDGTVAHQGSVFADMQASSPRQYSGVAVIAAMNTEFVDDRGVAECLSTGTEELPECWRRWGQQQQARWATVVGWYWCWRKDRER